MTETIAAIAKNFINLIYPLRCAGCGKDLEPLNEAGVCDLCLGRIRPNPKPHCARCGRSMESGAKLCMDCKKAKPSFEKANSAYLYEGPLKEIIHIFKYKGRLSLAKTLSKMTIAFIKDNPGILSGVDVLTFVPLHSRRLKERGFNQSRILAFNLSKECAIPVLDTLEKAIVTKHQNELTRADRLANLKDAFRIRKGVNIAGLSMMLLDDVMTTGATLNECAKVLRRHGAREVRCLTVAR